MRRFLQILTLAAGMASVAMPQATQVPPAQPPPQQPPPSQPAQPAPARPPAPAPAAPAPAAQPAPTTQPAAPQTIAHTTTDGNFVLDTDTTLVELINILARQMKLNYILDPRVGKGSVSIHTYGEIKPIAMMPLLMTVLRVNGATMVQVGDLYRIIPISEVSKLPIEPVQNPDPKTLPDDERMIMNIVFLKYATASEMQKLLQPFMGEGASSSVYEPANLMIIEDNSRSMKRTMELLAMFDSDTFAGQRVRLFDVNNSRPSDLVKDLDSVFKAYALSDKSAVRFIPVDRINTLIAVAPNPGVFDQVKKWIEKLDIPVKSSSAGGINNYVYRLKYGDAASVAMAIMALYSGNPMALLQMSAMMNSGMYAAGMGLNGTGGGMMGGMGMGGMGMGGFGMSGYGTGMGGYGMGMGGYGMGGYGGYGMGGYGSPYGSPYMSGMMIPTGTNGIAPAAPATGQTSTTGGVGQTGQYLQPGTTGAASASANLPHIIPNPFDNTLLIQGTEQEYQQILDLLRQLDVAPRQILIDAKIYEVDLTDALSAGVESYLQKVNSGAATGGTGGTAGATGSGLTPSRALTATAGAAGLGLTTGALVLRSSELLAVLQASESVGKSKVISSPSIIATDSIMATMNVGSQVPVLTSQAVAGGVQSGGSSVFANTVSNQSTGVTLNILAHANSSGMVTMMINQQVSAPQPAAASAAIQSPSFSNRSVSTQVMVQDGDTVAIGGAILESQSDNSSGVPFLHRIPVLGALFGAKSYNLQRTELIIFLTPRVIYDPSQIIDATDEIRSNLKRVSKLMKDQ